MLWNIWPSKSDAKETYLDIAGETCRLFYCPWLCFSDFYGIMSLNEKLRGKDRNLSMAVEFREVVHDCNMEDLKCKGYPFTWSSRFGLHLVEKRLDRFLRSED